MQITSIQQNERKQNSKRKKNYREKKNQFNGQMSTDLRKIERQQVIKFFTVKCETTLKNHWYESSHILAMPMTRQRTATSKK